MAIAENVFHDDAFMRGGAAEQMSSGGVVSLLLEGEGYAQTAKDLARVLGCTQREVTRMVERERLRGVPICASGRGFYLAATPEELQRYARSYDRRLRNMHKTRNAIEETLIAATGQQALHLDNLGGGADG